MTLPTELNIDHYQGDRLEIFIEVLVQIFDDNTGVWIDGPPKDLTGITFAGDVKSNKADVEPLVSFTFQAPTPTNGQVLCVLYPADTKLMTEATYYYDIQFVTSPEDIETYIAGAINMTPEVTR